MVSTKGKKKVAESVVFQPQVSYPSAEEGKVFYNDSFKELEYFDGTQWRRIIPDVA